jgi:hypothetical protein
MQHPFIHDLSDKTLEELQTAISDLNKKLNFAYSMQNGTMINQLKMMLESYNTENSKRMDALYKKQNIQDQINISSDKK